MVQILFFSYCMKKNLTEVPDVWICEACTSTDDIVSPKYGREEEFLDSFGVAHHEGLHSGTPGEVCADRSACEKLHAQNQPFYSTCIHPIDDRNKK